MANEQDNAAQQAQMQNFMQMFGMGGGLGQAGGGLYNLFNPGKNPATDASNTIGKIPGQTQQYYQPYMDAGKGALSDLQNQYKDLLGGNKQNQLGANFKEGPGYQYALQNALGAGTNANAAGGMLGTPMHQEQNMGIAEGLAGKEYDKYMQNQMGLYGSGLSGEQGLNQQGFDANKNYADQLANVLGQQAAYGYQGQKGQNEGHSNAMSNIFSGLGMAGGAMLGGPAGASMGGSIGSQIPSWFSSMFGGH